MRKALLKVVGVVLVASALVAVPHLSEAANPEFSETADEMWMTNGVGRVYAITTGGNTAFVGGTFTGMRETYNGSTVSQRYVAAVDMWSGELRSNFDPVLNGGVRALALSPDAHTLYVGGTFTQVNGVSRTKIAAINVANGNLRAGFDVDIKNFNVDALAVTSAGDVFVGGSFNVVNNQGQRALAKVDGQSGELINFDANITTGKVVSLRLTDDESRLYIGTSIDEDGKATYGDLLAVNPANGNPIPGFNASGVDDPVLDIALTDDKIYLAMGGGGGEAQILRTSNGSRRARFRADGDVQAVEVIGDRAYFSGHWVERFGSADSFHFTSVDVATDQVDESYYPRLNGTNGLHDLHFDGYHFWMGGEVTDGNPVARRGFARYSPTGSTGPRFPLIDEGASWRYLDDGSHLGSAWRNLNYDDGDWRRGDAELGYGDGDEETVIRDGSKSDRHITTYFRREVAIYDHDDIDFLEIELKRDDGAVVYINGTEVVRDNMPAGTIGGDTLASEAIGGAAEDLFFRWIISPQVLVEGDNIVAVEVHQAGPTSPDVSFDLELLADDTSSTFIAAGADWRYRDDGPSLGAGWRRLNHDDSDWKRGPAQLGYGEGDEATVINDGPNKDRHITSYFRRTFTIADLQSISTLELELLRDDGAVVYLNKVEVVRSNMPNGAINSEVEAKKVARKPREDDWYRYSLDPGLLEEGDNILAVEIHQAGPKSSDHSFDARLSVQASPELLVKRDRKWRYHDKGKDKGTVWRELGYARHRHWDRSRAELGYGDGDETTVLASGPPGDHYPTTYFRRHFRVTDPDVFTLLDIGIVRDDGAVIYINGEEVVRTNMPSGTITYETLAAGGAPNEGSYNWFTVPASALKKGKNAIAVEIHQSGPGSSDISFNLELEGR